MQELIQKKKIIKKGINDNMETSILSWLDRASAKYKEKTVYTDASGSVSFQDLDAMTRSIGTGIARRLSPGNPVAVMTGRHLYTPACYLGAARAGCFYAPMDASMPERRLNQILQVINVKFLLVDREHLEKASTLAFPGEILIMEDLLETPADDALLSAAQKTLTGFSPLYVIFTSGSTGVPKGVLTSHYSLMCYLDGLNEILHLNEEDVLGNQSPLDYIAAIRDMYLPLITGAATVIIPKNEFAMVNQLFDTLNKYKVTTLCWSAAGLETPAKLGAFDNASVPRHLKHIVFSGSVIAGKYLKLWQQHLPGVQLINQYGPTEATASCTWYEVREEVNDDTILPIGVPYKHYQVFLLNEDHTQTPQGETGEICIKGPALALGYYGAVELTQKSFIQNPLNPNYRELIYLTGDLGRMRKDGILEFCGRKDRQIKHMGHRIELDEIEIAAMQVEGVTECCALYDKEKSLLYLFYTGTAKSKEIVLYFRANMPAFMVPRKLISLEAMPLLPNGKRNLQELKKLFK